MRYYHYISAIILILLISSCGAPKKGSSRTSYPLESSPREYKDVRNHYAQLLHVHPHELNPALYAYIDEWIGTPHRLGGQDKSGIDCSGFVNNLFQRVYNMKLPRTSREMAEIVKRKYDHQLKEGDLVFFAFGEKEIDHVGVYLHNDMFVHVSTKRGVMISNLKESWFYKYLKRCGTPRM